MADPEQPSEGRTRRRRVRKARKPDTSSTEASRRADDAKGKPWTFPKHTLEEAIRGAKAIEEKTAGNPTRADMLARAVGFNHATDCRFQDLLKAGRRAGPVPGRGARATVPPRKIDPDVGAPL